MLALGQEDGQELIEDIRTFKKDNNLDRVVMVWCGSTEAYRPLTNAHESPDGSVCTLLENIGNLFYSRPSVRTRFATTSVSHYPIKNPSPAGYLVTGSTQPDGFQLTVPPDGAVPLKVGSEER